MIIFDISETLFFNIGIDVFLRGQSNDKAVNQERDDETIKRE